MQFSRSADMMEGRIHVGRLVPGAAGRTLPVVVGYRPAAATALNGKEQPHRGWAVVPDDRARGRAPNLQKIGAGSRPRADVGSYLNT
jgi:hypothetical protein